MKYREKEIKIEKSVEEGKKKVLNKRKEMWLKKVISSSDLRLKSATPTQKPKIWHRSEILQMVILKVTLVWWIIHLTCTLKREEAGFSETVMSDYQNMWPYFTQSICLDYVPNLYSSTSFLCFFHISNADTYEVRFLL